MDAQSLCALWSSELATGADRYTMDILGMPSAVVMERAACCVALEVRDLVPAPREVWVLVGPGNNGADGLAIARLLNGWGTPSRAFVVSDHINDAVTQQLALARSHGVDVRTGVPRSDPPSNVVLVDALLGTGTKGAPRGVVLDALHWLIRLDRPVVAVDIPTGVDPDDGHLAGEAVHANVTVTFGRSKPGLHVTPGSGHAGRVVVAPIGLSLPAGTGTPFGLIDPTWVNERIDQLPAAEHKGERGHVAIFGGSVGTPGAAVLAGSSALRAGAGLVTIVSSDSAVQEQIVLHRPELMVTPRIDPLSSNVSRANALVVGPGLTADNDLSGLSTLWSEDERPAVWDASGLACVPACSRLARVRVLTPHPGEAARMLRRLAEKSWSSDAVQAQRIAAARKLAEFTQAVVVLKGAGSLVVSPDGDTHVCTSGTPSLATAGTGDCLAGVIGALLARGVSASEAARIGVHVHGLAGELAEAQRAGSVAMDIADALGPAMATRRAPRGWLRLRLS